MKKIYLLINIMLLGVLSSCFLRYDEPILTETVHVDNLTAYDFNESLKKNGPLTELYLPSVGDVNVLVIPVFFDSYTIEELNNRINIIDKGFNGTIEDNGYYSVKEFYQISSFNKLNFNFDVFKQPYKPLYNSSYYERHSTDGSNLILKETLINLDDKIDYSKYDNDKDGYIDGIWLIYDHKVSYSSGNDLWWAYVTGEEMRTNDNVSSCYYGFAGFDFFNPQFEGNSGPYPHENILIDTHTFIHETGHLLGLDDYYDYDDSRGAINGGTHGLDYMDFNYGDHGPINKLLLGWLNPIIINDECDVVIKPYATSGEVYLVTKTFKGTLYDSYYLIINYTNDLLYNTDPYFDQTGILIYEVNAEKNLDRNNEVTFNGGSYQTGFKYDNSDTSKYFLSLVTSNKVKQIGNEVLNKDVILFTKNETVKLNSQKFSVKINDIDTNNNIKVSVKNI